MKSANGRSQHSRIGNWSRRNPARSAGTTARSALPGSHSANAPRGWTAVVRWPEDRREEVRVADGDRPDPARLGRVAVAERGAVGAAVQPAAPRFRAQVAVVVRVGDAEDLAVERVDGVGQLAVAGPVRRPAGDRLEWDGRDAGRQRAERLGPPDQPEQVRGAGIRGTIPYVA